MDIKNIFTYFFRIRGKYGGWKSAMKRTIFQSAVQLPVVGGIYRLIYKEKVRRVIEKKYPAVPNLIRIEPYNLCNGGCVMCPYGEMTRPKEIMSMDLYKKIVDDVKENGVKAISLSFFSEPFLDPHIFERIKYTKDAGMLVKIFSNASVMTKEKVNQLLDCPPDAMVISVDAVNPETYKKIRTGLNLEMVKQNIRYLIEERNRRGLQKPTVTTNFVLQDINAGELEDYKKEWGGIVNRTDVHVDNMLVKGVPKHFKHPFPCGKVFDIFNVCSSGKVALCENDFDGKHILGDFNKQTFKEIFYGPEMQKYRDLHKNFQSDQIKLCKECMFGYTAYAYKWWFIK